MSARKRFKKAILGLDQKTWSFKNKMERRSHQKDRTLMVKASQALQTPVGSIQGKVPLSMSEYMMMMMMMMMILGCTKLS